MSSYFLWNCFTPQNCLFCFLSLIFSPIHPSSTTIFGHISAFLIINVKNTRRRKRQNRLYLEELLLFQHLIDFELCTQRLSRESFGPLGFSSHTHEASERPPKFNFYIIKTDFQHPEKIDGRKAIWVADIEAGPHYVACSVPFFFSKPWGEGNYSYIAFILRSISLLEIQEDCFGKKNSCELFEYKYNLLSVFSRYKFFLLQKDFTQIKRLILVNNKAHIESQLISQ